MGVSARRHEAVDLLQRAHGCSMFRHNRSRGRWGIDGVEHRGGVAMRRAKASGGTRSGG
jgi:hypothetical protein